MDPTRSDLKLAIEVHSRLLKFVKPATPDSIRQSSLKGNPALFYISTLGVLAFSALVLLAVLPLIGIDLKGLEKDTTILRLCGAVIGSALLAFWNARSFLLNSTFSSQYAQDYLVRFFIGIVTGFILGGISINVPENGVMKFGPFTLAVVGGFSAEAVVQILKRIAEVLVTVIQGSSEEQAKAKTNKIVSQKLTETAADLQDALQATNPDEMSARIKKIATNLLKD